MARGACYLHLLQRWQQQQKASMRRSMMVQPLALQVLVDPRLTMVQSHYLKKLPPWKMKLPVLLLPHYELSPAL